MPLDDTHCAYLPLSYSGNPGVNDESYRGETLETKHRGWCADGVQGAPRCVYVDTPPCKDTHGMCMACLIGRVYRANPHFLDGE